jgi:hypothetical protein
MLRYSFEPRCLTSDRKVCLGVGRLVAKNEGCVTCHEAAYANAIGTSGACSRIVLQLPH